MRVLILPATRASEALRFRFILDSLTEGPSALIATEQDLYHWSLANCAEVVGSRVQLHRLREVAEEADALGIVLLVATSRLAEVEMRLREQPGIKVMHPGDLINDLPDCEGPERPVYDEAFHQRVLKRARAMRDEHLALLAAKAERQKQDKITFED